MLDDFVANQGKLPRKLQHLSILGIFFRDGDGIVHKSSVKAGSLIYKGKIASHREVVIVGKNAQTIFYIPKVWRILKKEM